MKNTNTHAASLRASAQRKLDSARVTLLKCETEGGDVSPAKRSQVEASIAEAKDLNRQATAIEASDAKASRLANAGAAGPTGLLAAFKSAGWSPGKRAVIPATVAFKTASFDGSADDISPDRFEGAALGADTRRLYTIFPATAVDAGTTSVQVVHQSSRTLATPASMQRAIDAVTTKPETATVRSLVSLPMKQIASKESGIPNILLLQDGFTGTVNTDLRLAYEAAIDDLAVDAIAASTPTPAGTPGIDLTEQIVFAAAAMTASGYSGSVVAISPEDWAELALLRGAAEQFARTDPLAGFRFVASPAVTVPLLIDPAAAGRLFLSGVSLQTFEENDGGTNSSLVRYEGHAAFHVERADAIRTIQAGS